MVWSLSVAGADLVCPRVTTNNRRSPCHRAREGHDDLFCSKIKASRVLGPAARSEGHYARIRILIRDSISCVARPHCRTSDHGHTLIKDSYQHLRADLRRGKAAETMGPSDLRGRRGRVSRANRPVFALAAAKLLHPLVQPETIHWSLLIERPDDGDARPVASVVQEQTRARPWPRARST